MLVLNFVHIILVCVYVVILYSKCGTEFVLGEILLLLIICHIFYKAQRDINVYLMLGEKNSTVTA